MNSSTIRAIVQYNDERVGVLFERSSSQKEFIEKCLEELEIINEDWDLFEIINVEYQCKLRTTNHIRKEDELLLLKKKSSSVKSQVLGNENIEESISAVKEINFGYLVQDSQVFTPEKIGTILMTKEELKDFSRSEEQNEKAELKIAKKKSLRSDEGKDEDEEGFSEAPVMSKEVESQDGFYKKQENEKEVIIDVSGIINKEYEDREALKNQIIKTWGAQEKMKLSFTTRETKLIKDDSKVSTIFCSKKDELNCPFFLEFRTLSDTAPYMLASYWDTHNHILSKYDNSYAVTEEVLNTIKVMKATVKSISELTETINNLFKKNFHRDTIKNLVNKLKEEEIGIINDDGKTLVAMLKEDFEKRGGFYDVLYNGTQLLGCCYMSKRMQKLLEYFYDVIIIDVTHGTNRFNLPFLDVALINNYGQTCICYFSLMPDQKYQSFEWCLRKLKTQLKKMPKIIFSDDEESLRKGKFVVFICII